VTYRVYVRWGQGERISDKTVTRSPVVAESAYRELVCTREFWCCKAAAVLSLDNRQLEYRRFDRIVPADPVLAEQVRLGRVDPRRYRWALYPQERDLIEADPQIEACVLDAQIADAPILDDRPIRLFHDAPEGQ
jgi:hypothetical protein